MKIEPTFDMDQVKEILMIPEVWERAAEDGADKETYYPGFDNMCGWLICKEKEDIVGLIYVHNDDTKSVKIHPYILPSYRGKGKDMMFSFYRWFIENGAHTAKLLISIPSCYKRLYKFSKRIGFIDEGINRKSYFKNGEMHDQWNLGLTVSEIKEILL